MLNDQVNAKREDLTREPWSDGQGFVMSGGGMVGPRYPPGYPGFGCRGWWSGGVKSWLTFPPVATYVVDPRAT